MKTLSAFFNFGIDISIFRTIFVQAILLGFYLNSSFVSGDILDTFYGKVEVNEPVIIDLIKSSAFQRLRGIHQYGVAYYIGAHMEPYNRFDHSIGVFTILREKRRLTKRTNSRFAS